MIDLRSDANLSGLIFGALVLAGVAFLIMPMFGEYLPYSASNDSVNHTALVEAAVDTLRTTGGIPISSDAINPGIEYPYFLFGNAGFYIASALTSYLLGISTSTAMALVVSLGFAAGAYGTFALARGAGVQRYLAMALGILYAAGPYQSLNLYTRLAFPEYLTWEVLPLLLLVARRGFDVRRGAVAALGASVALSLPFYLHKLVAPYAILTMGLLAFPFASRRSVSLCRALVIVGVAICFTIPAWYPAFRALDSDAVGFLSLGGRPVVLNPSIANLFWPYAQDSLGDAPDRVAYGGRFALQVGVLPTVGFLAAVFTLVTRPRLALRPTLAVPLALFALNTALILDWFGVWSLLPAPFRYVQFTYRLIGLSHFLGFVLLAESLGHRDSAFATAGTPLLRRILSLELVGIAALSVLTYWYRPALLPARWTDIKPQSLGDLSGFYPRSPGGTLPPLPAIAGGNQWAAPREVPADRRVRLPLGGSSIDARGLPSGYYLLPTFYYPFVEVIADDGSSVPVYRLERRAVVRHMGEVNSYLVRYGLRSEFGAVGAGLVLFLAYAAAVKFDPRRFEAVYVAAVRRR